MTEKTPNNYLKKTHDKLQQNKKESQQEFLEALRKSMGMVTHACKKISISRDVYYLWMRTDPEFVDEVKWVYESIKDFGESILMQKIRDGDTVALIYWAKHKLRDRGYSEKHTYPKIKFNQINTVEDVNKALTQVLDFVNAGDISLENAKDLSLLLENKRRALESSELAQRLEELERRVKNE